MNEMMLQIVNQHLLKDLTEQGLWDDEMKNQLIANNGSVQVGKCAGQPNAVPHRIETNRKQKELR